MRLPFGVTYLSDRRNMLKSLQLFDKRECDWDRERVMKLPLTLMVITLNEESNIERCLRSVPFVDEVLIIDSQSSDQTVAIAEKMGAKVLQKAWQGFGPQKKWGTAQARNDWILSLDADEELSSELADEIKSKFEQLNSKVGYQFPRRSFHLGRWIAHGGWYPDRQLRLYNRQFSNWPDSEIHERVQAPQVETFQSNLNHYVFKNLSHQIQTNDRYSSLLAQQDFKAGKRFSFFKLCLKPWSKFFECYLVKLGFLDGLAGLVIAVSAGYSIFLRQAKLWELSQKNEAKK